MPALSAPRAAPLHAPLRDRRGGVNIWVALAAAVAAGLSAFALDTGRAYLIQAQLQAAADAGALAGARVLADGSGDPVKTARAYARKALDEAGLAGRLRSFKVETGGWTPQDRRFVAKVAAPDAVRVTLSRAERGEAGAGTAFLPILGARSWTASAASIAGKQDRFEARGAGFAPCLAAGIVSGQFIAVAENAQVEGMCLHAQQGVAIGAGLSIGDGASVSMPDPEGMLGLGAPIPEDLRPALAAAKALRARDVAPGAAAKADALITGYALSAQMVTLRDWPTVDLSPGAQVHVHCERPGVLVMPTGVLRDIQVTTNCSLVFQPGAQFVNSIVGTTMDAVQGGGVLDPVARGKLGIPAPPPPPEPKEGETPPPPPPAPEAPVEGWAVSGARDVDFGAPDDCASGGGSLLIADGKVRFAPGMGLHGATVIASGDVAMPPDAPVDGVSVQAGGGVGVPPGARLRGCDGSDWLIGLRTVVSLLR